MSICTCGMGPITGCRVCDAPDDSRVARSPEPNCASNIHPSRVGQSNVAQPADDWIALVLRDVAEIPDRTSPDEGPEFLIVTGEELRMIIERRAPVGTPVGARHGELANRLRAVWSSGGVVVGDLLLEAARALDGAPKIQEQGETWWIAAKVLPPEHKHGCSETVLATDGKHIAERFYNFSDNEWQSDGPRGGYLWEVTHWKPRGALPTNAVVSEVARP